MEEQEGKNLASKWLLKSEVKLSDDQFDAALWTAANAIIELVPEVERNVFLPREHAEIPDLPEGTEALDELLIVAGDHFFRITGWHSEEGLEVSIRRLSIRGFGAPTITEMRKDRNGADVRFRGWQFPHMNGSTLFLPTDRIVNASYPDDHPERFAEELAKIAGWDVTEAQSPVGTI